MARCPTCGGETVGLFGVASPKPCVLTFATIGAGAKSWCLTQEQIDVWQGDYPQQDVVVECRRARSWLEANGRKTAKGMPRFLVSWLNRAVERRVMLPSRPGPEARGVAAPVHTSWHCPHVDPCSHRAMCQNASALKRPEKQAS